MAIDRHESINWTDWRSMLQHVSKFAAYFDIETRGSRVGLVSFDEISTLDIRLDAHNNTQELQTDILSQFAGGNGRDLSVALYRMRAECFKSSKGTLMLIRKTIKENNLGVKNFNFENASIQHVPPMPLYNIYLDFQDIDLHILSISCHVISNVYTFAILYILLV